MGLKTLALVILSLMLLYFDGRLQACTELRYALSYTVTPIQYLVSWPLELAHKVEGYFTTQNHLLKQNQALHEELLRKQLTLQKFIILQHENKQLKALLNSSVNNDDKTLAAQILAVQADIFGQQIILNKGKQEEVYVGQPIVDANGVVGQVVKLNANISRVMLLTSRQSAIPVEDSRSGIRAIAAGTGVKNGLELLYVTDTMDIKPGDVLTTSGLGMQFPLGYKVGTVINVQHIAGQQFAKITVEPVAKLQQSRQVLLVWPEQLALAKQVKRILATP